MQSGGKKDGKVYEGEKRDGRRGLEQKTRSAGIVRSQGFAATAIPLRGIPRESEASGLLIDRWMELC